MPAISDVSAIIQFVHVQRHEQVGAVTLRGGRERGGKCASVGATRMRESPEVDASEVRGLGFRVWNLRFGV
jgi:hypothetical protein